MVVRGNHENGIQVLQPELAYQKARLFLGGIGVLAELENAIAGHPLLDGVVQHEFALVAVLEYPGCREDHGVDPPFLEKADGRIGALAVAGLAGQDQGPFDMGETVLAYEPAARTPQAEAAHAQEHGQSEPGP
jgi:glyoxylate utilization-related uncharacterized protein